MKRSGILIIAAVTLIASACQPENKPDVKVDPVSATFRFVASEDLQSLYEIKMYWKTEGSAENCINISCKSELDDSFILANNNLMKSIFKAGRFTVGSFTSATVIEYRLTFTRKLSVPIDPEKTYDIAFGEDLTTYDGDKVTQTDSQFVAVQGLLGSRLEEYVDRCIRGFYEEDKYADISF